MFMNEGLTKIFVLCDYLHALKTPYGKVYVFQLTRLVFLKITSWTDISKKYYLLSLSILIRVPLVQVQGEK